MRTLPSSEVIRPFGKINLWHQADGSKKVRVYIFLEDLMFERTTTGIAIDGSLSMRPYYGLSGGLLGFLAGRRTTKNIVSAEVQQMCAYLAGRLDAEGKTTVVYWATNSGPDGLESLGQLTEYAASSYDFKGPKAFGNRTKLAPVVRYFAEQLAANPQAKRGMYVFITDGILDDLKATKDYSIQLAREIADGKRKPVKFVLIGVGSYLDEKQMIELDDLDTGTNIDLWYHRIATEMDQVGEIGIETVDENMILSDTGIVRDALGDVIQDYRDTGLPALLEFTLPANAATAFTLELGGQIYRQPLS